MAENAQPPAGGNTNAAIPGIIAISFLFAAAACLYGLRIYTRVRPTFKLGAVDHIISVAFICELIVYITTIIAINLGFGRYSYYISHAAQIQILKCIFVVAFFSSLSAPIARISIGAMLLHFELSNTRKMIIWVLLFIQLAIALASSLVMLLQCRPIHAFWESVPGGVCWSNSNSQIYGYTATALGIFSDLVFAIVPIIFIWPLSRPFLERVLLCVLMGLGICATTAAAIKLYYIRTWKYGEEAVSETVSVYMWYRVEEMSLIAAACAPFLKRSIESLLNRISVPRFGFVLPSLKSVGSNGQSAATDVSNREFSAN